MDFLEHLNKKLADVGQEVAQQTRNMTDIAHYNGLCSDRKRQIDELYRLIGQRYYESHKTAAEDPEAAVMGQITGLYQEIIGYQKEAAKLRGMEKCPSCGQEVPIGSAFCSVCGARIKTEETVSVPPAEQPTCPKCHKEVTAEAAFCPHCGESLTEEMTEETETP